ncbi:hybrid sensor histidine kinase/response regulator transcription factor [Galbibacter pacificus]|uniref:histidine kinase n=1 Tax=Galbibacter pacificus TaxID=2996052 RepID=A0ABT6FVC2_9FLAO|nr:hybrid sensor histidine kinase/response regulator transcription factor [Galbibacter pacificus]MDG3583862.1 two-component regulator propeller domain-containing protein [Galbibacter pacificus]MDG3587220.1 response regulator [Galbibacter pacificus]
MKKSLLFSIFFMLLSAVICAQEYYLKHYQVDNGLSHNSVISSLQDNHGFLWFGTKDGLNRFDGYSFKLYQNDPQDTTSIGSNFIQTLHQYKGFLWVGTDNGLYKFDELHETFELLELTQNQSVQDIETDAHGNLWFIAGATLYKYNIEKKKYTVFDPADFFGALSITKSQDNTLWVASFNQLYKYDPDKISFTPMGIAPIENTIFPFIISTIYALNSHTILIGTQNHGVIEYNTQSGTQKRLLANESGPVYVRNFAKKGAGELWIATENGVYIYNIQDKTYDHIQKKYTDDYALSDNAVYTITVDNEQGVWMGTYFRGINYYPKQYTPFKKYFPKLNENSLSGNIVREITKDKYGNLWLGTEDAGLNKFNLKTKKFTSYNPLKNNTGLAYYNIHGILPDGDKLWAGTFEHGLDVLDITSGKVTKHYGMGSKGGLFSNFVYAVHKTKSNDIVILTTGGIQQYNAGKDTFEGFKPIPEKYFFNCFMEISATEAWVGSYRNGLFHYNEATGRKEVYTYNNKNANSISSNAINDLYKDHKGNIWVTTENGLNKYRPETNDFERFNTKDGFPSNVMYSILEDNDFNLWISSSNGLVKFNPEDFSIKTYTKANGLMTDQFNYRSAFKDDNGDMYFGSVDGMVSFNPDNFIKNTYNPPILLTNLRVNNKEVSVTENGSPLSKSITYSDEINLKHTESSFSIDFSALSFNASQMTKYWYQLEGLNDDWVELNKSRTAYFTKLPPGNYTLKYKALNSNGSWSRGKDLRIIISPPFWASNTAYAFYFLFISTILFFAVRFYHKQTEEKNNRKIRQLNNKKEKEIYQAKIEFFTNVAHEIRTPLTLIKSPLEKILKTTQQNGFLKENLNIMSKNTSRLLDLVNQLLDFRRTEIEGVDLTFVKANITAMVKNTHTRFSQAIEEKNVLFEFSYPDEPIHAYVDSEALKKILSNLFNNAIKYAKNKVFVTLKRDEASFILIVKNDGELIPVHLKDKIFEPFFRAPEVTHQTGTGIGLSLAHSLTELHKGTLSLDNTDVAMNTFILKLPLFQEKKFELYSSNTLPIKDTGLPAIYHDEDDTEEVKKTTILLVEDNEDLLDFIAKDLREEYFVHKAAYAEKALEIIQNDNIQLVISDVMMPGMDGFELCKKIKTSLETSHIPVILLTSKSAISAKVEGLESGADAYIEKPFSIEYLHIQIKNLLENRKHIMQHYSSTPLAHIRSIAHSKTDESFIKALDKVIYENIADHNLSVEILAEIMNMSRSTLYRKIKDISNLSPNELINITRLKKAAELLRTGDYKIYEVSEMVGYNSQTSFGRNFQKQFNMTPTEYINSKEV